MVKKEVITCGVQRSAVPRFLESEACEHLKSAALVHNSLLIITLVHYGGVSGAISKKG